MQDDTKKNVSPDVLHQVRLMAVITAFCLLGDSMLYIALPVQWEHCGLTSLWEVGVLLSVNRLVRLPLNPLVGWLYSRIDLRTGLILAAGLAVISTLGYALVHSFAAWLLLRCLWGLAWTLLKLGALFTILELSSRNNRGYLMGTYQGIFRLGSLGGMLGGGILADLLGLKIVAAFFGLFTMAALLLAFLKLPSRHMSDSARDKSSTRLLPAHLFHQPGLLRVMVTGFMVALTFQGLYAATLSRMVGNHAGASMSLGGLVLGCATVAGSLQALRWAWEPWLAPRFGRLSDGPRGRIPVFSACLWAAVVQLILLGQSLPLWLWFSLLLGLQVAATGLTTLVDAVASDAAEQYGHGAVVLSSFAFVMDLGAATGPLLAYGLGSFWGLDVTYVLVAVLLALTTLSRRLRLDQP